MSYNILAGGSDYVMNQYNEQDQTRESGMLLSPPVRNARSPSRRPPSSIFSQYVDMDLRSFIAVNQNRNYQEFPSTIQRTPLVGHPISADELRKRVDGLENAVYSPLIANGTLYFVSLDNDTRTARSSTSIDTVRTAASSSSVDMNDATFTFKELEGLLPQYALKRLVRYRKDGMKQKPHEKDNVDIDKLREAITTLAQLRQQDLSSHPAFENINLVNTTEPDIVYLRNALNLLQPSQVHAPVTNSTTTSYTDTSATNQSVTGRFNDEKLVDAATNTDEILRNYPCSCNTDASRTMPSASVYMAMINGQILDDTTTAVEVESMTKPQLITEWERQSDTTAKDYYDDLHTPIESLSIDTAHSVDNDTIDQVLSSSFTSKELTVLPTALARSTPAMKQTELRMDTPEEDVDTAITIPDSMDLRMDTPEKGVDTAITIQD